MSLKFPLATTSWDKEEINAITKVVDSGNFTMGREVASFERDFARYTGSRYSVMVNSGSSAVLLMIAALFYTKNKKFMLNRGDEIIVPAVSWSTTYSPLNFFGLKLKFVDIDLQTLNYDIDQLSEAITDATRVVMVVNLLGNPNDFDSINSIIRDKNIVLIEDNCEALGATFKGRQSGTFGVLGAFSTFFSHHISTMEGGVIVTDDEELFQILLCLRAHGWTRNLPELNKITGKKSEDPFEESFKFVLPGFNLRPVEINGAIGSAQLKKLPNFISKRRRNAFLFREVMSEHQDIMIQREVGESSWFGFSLIIKPESLMTRRELIMKLERRGFEVRPIVAGNFVKNEVVKYFNYEIHRKLANADYIDKNGLFIGNHHYPIDDAIAALKGL